MIIKSNELRMLFLTIQNYIFSSYSIFKNLPHLYLLPTYFFLTWMFCLVVNIQNLFLLKFIIPQIYFTHNLEASTFPSSLASHIWFIGRFCLYHLKNIFTIQTYFIISTAIIMMQFVITNYPDYCYSPLTPPSFHLRPHRSLTQ